jgi:hypothetical protein
MSRPLKVAIIYPSGDMLHAQFCGSLVNLVAYSQSLGIQTFSVNPRSSLVQVSRFIGVETAIANGADKILFIDSDQTFQHNALAMLLDSKEDIVGAASLTRKEPIQYTCKDKEGNRIDFKEKTGLVEVHTNGFPMTLIDCSVFDKIDKPYFNVSYNEGSWIGEDESFCHAAREAGYKIMINADVKIGHLGTREYI